MAATDGGAVMAVVTPEVTTPESAVPGAAAVAGVTETEGVTATGED